MEDVRGVYYILNMINNKIYIGSSIHVNKRFHEHKLALNNGTHYNGHLQNAWKMYNKYLKLWGDYFMQCVMILHEADKAAH